MIITYGSSRGFTLLELLAAVVLLAAAIGVVASAGLAPVRAVRGQALVASLQDLDARARLAARANGFAQIEREPGALVLRAGGGRERIASVAIPESVKITFGGPGAERVIPFDGSGRSASYRIEIEEGTDRRRIMVHGLTGWAQQEAP